MQLETDSRKTSFTLTARNYSITYMTKEPQYVRLSAGELSQKLCIWSSCNSPDGRDIMKKITKRPYMEKIRGGRRVYFQGTSALHGKKTYIFDCYEDYFEYYYVFDCLKPIDRIHYFFGLARPALFAPSGKKKKKESSKAKPSEFKEIKSSKAFTRLFSPEPNGLDRQWVSAQEYGKISVNDDQNFNGRNWFFTPGLLSFAVSDDKANQWISMGVAPKSGEYNFNDYEFLPGRFMALDLTYFGQTNPDGAFETPHLVFHFGKTEKTALENYVSWLLKSRRVRRNRKRKASWWKEPILCGWGEQCAQSDFQNVLGKKDNPHEWNPHQYANQANYENMMAELEKRNIPVKTVIIDDKWQKQRGLPLADEGKWPDMRAFVDKMHKKGKKVILWWGLFTGEGVHSELCITKGDEKLCEDPTNPAFLKLMKECVNTMLSDKPGCYNADGFKIDFTANLPSDPHADRYGKAWGIELLKQYISEIYKSAKKAKKDALIITHTANPYFMNVCDAIRLNDICEHYQDSIVRKMEFRAEMARLACPGLLIDTDNWPCPSRRSWLEYMKIQPQVGIPSLYYVSRIDSSLEEIKEEDWKTVASVWKEYIKSLK